MTASPPRQAHDGVILDEADVARAITRLASSLVESERGTDRLVLLGIQTRGVPLAKRIQASITAIEGVEVPQGELDITMYRDDLRRQPTRRVGRTRVPVSIDGATVVLVDDVLYSGRTVVAALDALKDLGRPAAVRLLVLVDRGHRQVPVRPDHVGRDLPTAPNEHVSVLLREIDGVDEVRVTPLAPTQSTSEETR
ncbi:MAG TPA: bifunctional pyr operon transcriptional regulator/uracil phosphoribosyltransferase PyrR [Propionibacteriaceae bacterium]|nr:bifunctional pyr operon transcriptional regulator/uracil phosphoribosyltransferase PyrR [Propionibacteriaceae bacterium]